MSSPTVSSLSSKPVEWAPVPVKKLALTGIFVVTISSALGALTLIHLNGGHSLGYFNFVSKIGTSGAYCSFAFGGGFAISMVIIAVKEHRDHKKLIQRDQDSNNGPLKEKKPTVTPSAPSIDPKQTITSSPSATPATTASSTNLSPQTPPSIDPKQTVTSSPPTTPATTVSSTNLSPQTPSSSVSVAETPLLASDPEIDLGPASRADIFLGERIGAELRSGEWTIFAPTTDNYRFYDILIVKGPEGISVDRVKKDHRFEYLRPAFLEKFSIQGEFVNPDILESTLIRNSTQAKFDALEKANNLIIEKIFDKNQNDTGLVYVYQRVYWCRPDYPYYNYVMSVFEANDPFLQLLETTEQNLGLPVGADVLLGNHIAENLHQEGEWTILETSKSPYCHYNLLVIKKLGKVTVFRVAPDVEKCEGIDHLLVKQFSLEDVKFVPSQNLPFWSFNGDEKFKSVNRDMIFDETYIEKGLVLVYRREEEENAYRYSLSAFHRNDGFLAFLKKSEGNTDADRFLATECKLKPGQWTLIPPCHLREYYIFVRYDGQNTNSIPVYNWGQKNSQLLDELQEEFKLDVDKYTICLKNYFEGIDDRPFEKNELGINLEARIKFLTSAEQSSSESVTVENYVFNFERIPAEKEGESVIRWSIVSNKTDL